MTWRRVALVLVGLAGLVGLVALNLVEMGPLASQRDEPDLGALLLHDGDLPAGFRPVPEYSGPSNEPFEYPSWVPPEWTRKANMDSVPQYLRTWREPKPGRVVVATGTWLWLEIGAGVIFKEHVRSLENKTESEFDIPAVLHARGFAEPASGSGGTKYWATFRQGGLIFTILLRSPDDETNEDRRLLQQLVEKQARAVPVGQTSPLGLDQLSVQFAVGALAALLTYVGSISVVAWVRDPLRRSRRSGWALLRTPVPTGGAGVVDVTFPARRRRRRAHVGLILQLVGVAVVVTGLYPVLNYVGSGVEFWQLGLGLVLVVVGIAVAGVGKMVSAGPKRGPVAAPPLLLGRRRLSVALFAATATASVVVGLCFMYIVGIGAVVSGVSKLNQLILVNGVVCLVVGTLLHRHARRLAALAASDMLQRDPRPIVLYLRAFQDDKLTIRSAASARRSLLERLSPRRFDRFEEVLTRGLTAVGPVVAVNPPGTTLAPLGAARENLDHKEWQPAVERWMRQARLVVLGVAPTEPGLGLAWELHTMDAQHLWSTALLVLPPLSDDATRGRWNEFAPLLQDTAMAGHVLPADPADTLGLIGSPSMGWTAVTATRRDEWTYLAALAAAAERTEAAPESVRGGQDRRP